MINVVTVLTADSAETIIQQGGTGDWAADPAKVSKFPYVVCLRHGQKPNSPADAVHNAAFLVGKISGVEMTNKTDKLGRRRILIRFSEYAKVNGARASDRRGTNPVWFADFESLHIDLEKLTFVPVSGAPANETIATKGGMTFDMAKAGLAIHYNVPVDKIEIIIRS